MAEQSLRRELTDRRIRWRNRFKRYTLPFVLGLLTAIFGELADFDLLNIATAIFGVTSAILNEIGLRLGDTYRPIVNGVVGAAAGWFLVSALNWLNLFDRLFPNPPSFVFCDLELERKATILEVDIGETVQLVGREHEMRALEELLTLPSTEKFKFQTITAPTGLGKTRLAIEWLEVARLRKWDIGLIDFDRISEVKDWKARCPTALVIDEADSEFMLQQTGTSNRLESVMIALRSACGSGSPVRLLLVGQTAPWSTGQTPQTLRPYEAGEPIRLGPLDEKDLEKLAKNLSERAGADPETIVRECSGNPREAVILALAPTADNYQDALNDWVNRAVPELAHDRQPVDVSTAVGLVASSLIGPIKCSDLVQHFESFDATTLLRFFPRSSKREIEIELPRLVPGDWGQLLALRLLGKLPENLRETLSSEILFVLPGRLERSLGELWMRYPHWVPSHAEHPLASTWQNSTARILASLQSDLDARQSERVNVLRSLMKQHLKYTEELRPIEEAHDKFLQLARIADSRPFDLAVRTLETRAAINAIGCYGHYSARGYPGAYRFLDAWSDRIDVIMKTVDLSSNTELGLELGKATVNAISAYGSSGANGQKQAYEALEEWRDRFEVALQASNLAGDLSFRRLEAMTCINAVMQYGTSGASGNDESFQRLEIWGDKLYDMLGDPRFQHDVDLRRLEAIAIKNAIIHYGQAWGKGSTKAEIFIKKWMARLDSLIGVDELAFVSSIRMEELEIATNLLLHSRDVSPTSGVSTLDDWEQRLDEILSHPQLASDRAIRLSQAKATPNAINLISDYCQDEIVDRLNWWRERLDSILEFEEFAADPEIRSLEVRAIENAVLGLHRTAKLPPKRQIEEIGKWASRLDSLLEGGVCKITPDLSEAISSTIADIVHAYAVAAERGDTEQFINVEDWSGKFNRLVSMANVGQMRSVRETEVRMSACAISHYAGAYSLGFENAIVAIELWKARIDEIVRVPTWASDHKIRRKEAEACINAINFYSAIRDHESRLVWRSRLALIIQRFEGSSDFSSIAAKMNLSLDEQAAQGWPFGRYMWGSDGSRRTLAEPHAKGNPSLKTETRDGLS